MRLHRAFILLLIFTAVAAASAQQSAGTAAARAFLTRIYSHYEHHGHGIDYTGPRARNYFTASFVALMEADEKAAGPDNVSVIGDGDPFCGCQDWDGIWNLKINLEPAAANQLRARVSFALFAPKPGSETDLRSLEFLLVREGGNWRVDNVIDHADPKAVFDLRAAMQKEIDDLARQK